MENEYVEGFKFQQKFKFYTILLIHKHNNKFNKIHITYAQIILQKNTKLTIHYFKKICIQIN